MTTLSNQRHLFDIPDEIAYFNCAYYSPQLNESRRLLVDGVGQKSHPWERMANDFFDDADTIRRLAARLFGGGADGYAVIPAASYGLSTAARVLEPHLGKGDRILYAAEEFPSGVLPWMKSCRGERRNSNCRSRTGAGKLDRSVSQAHRKGRQGGRGLYLPLDQRSAGRSCRYRQGLSRRRQRVGC